MGRKYGFKESRLIIYSFYIQLILINFISSLN